MSTRLKKEILEEILKKKHMYPHEIAIVVPAVMQLWYPGGKEEDIPVGKMLSFAVAAGNADKLLEALKATQRLRHPVTFDLKTVSGDDWTFRLERIK